MVAKRRIAAGIILLAMLGSVQAGWSSSSFVECRKPPNCGTKSCIEFADDYPEFHFDHNGIISMNGERLDHKRLLLYAADAGRKRVPIVVKPRADTPYGKVALLLQTLQELGNHDVYCALPED